MSNETLCDSRNFLGIGKFIVKGENRIIYVEKNWITPAKYYEIVINDTQLSVYYETNYFGLRLKSDLLLLNTDDEGALLQKYLDDVFDSYCVESSTKCCDQYSSLIELVYVNANYIYNSHEFLA
ncbi:hypothetical protein RLOatenuis_7490 [Rickettsiales bacterium]|nr:hypothetical protein RLOatenuis_7490 [Rickettsiales bacterium]